MSASRGGGESVSGLPKADRDRDNDSEAPYDESNNRAVLDLGHRAHASERQAIAALLERYYRAALASDGAAACAMLYSTLAEGVPEDYGSYAGPPYMRASTCPAIMTLLFKHYRPLLAQEVPRLTISQIVVHERRGLALLRFGALPERQMNVKREGHTWRVAALLDSELP